MVGDTLLFWCFCFKYRFIKLDLVTVGKFGFHFSSVFDIVIDCVSVNPSAPVAVKEGGKGVVLWLYLQDTIEHHLVIPYFFPHRTHMEQLKSKVTLIGSSRTATH